MRIGYSLSIFALLAATPLAGAAVIVTHIGDTNPTTEGFTSVGGVAVLPVNDSGTPAWQITDNATGNDLSSYHEYYTLLGTNVNNPSGWTATAKIRVANSTYTPGAGASAQNNYGVILSVYDGQTNWLLDFVGTDASPANDGVWYAGTGTFAPPVQLMQMDTASAYHVYQMIYDPTAPNQIKVYVDGNLAGTILRSQEWIGIPGTATNIAYGSQSPTGVGSSDWNRLTFETGQDIQVSAGPSLPEPASLSLLAMGGVALLRRRRTK